MPPAAHVVRALPDLLCTAGAKARESIQDAESQAFFPMTAGLPSVLAFPVACKCEVNQDCALCTAGMLTG